MTTPADIYANGIKNKLKNYWAAWLPSSKFELGDVGILKGKIFHKISNLSDLGIKFGIVMGKDPSPIDYVSESGVSIMIKLSGETTPEINNIPAANAGIRFSFSSKGAFVIEADQTYEHSIQSLLELQSQIIPKYKENSWDKDWTVIVKIVTAPIATILISNSSNAKIELSCKGDISDGLIDLGKVAGQFMMTSQEGDVLKNIGAQNITPFFQIAKIKRRLFRDYSFDTKSFAPESSGLEYITPEMVQKYKEFENLLYFDIVSDPEIQ